MAGAEGARHSRWCSGGAVGNAGQERTRNQDGKRPQNPEGKPLSPPKVHAKKQWLQNAKVAAELESEADRTDLDDIVADTAARSVIEAPLQARAAGSTCTLEITYACPPNPNSNSDRQP